MFEGLFYKNTCPSSGIIVMYLVFVEIKINISFLKRKNDDAYTATNTT